MPIYKYKFLKDGVETDETKDFSGKESLYAYIRSNNASVISVEEIKSGKATPEDIELLKELAEHIQQTSLCGLGQTSGNHILTALRHFPQDFELYLGKGENDFANSKNKKFAIIKPNFSHIKKTNFGKSKIKKTKPKIKFKIKKPKSKSKNKKQSRKFKIKKPKRKSKIKKTKQKIKFKSNPAHKIKLGKSKNKKQSRKAKSGFAKTKKLARKILPAKNPKSKHKIQIPRGKKQNAKKTNSGKSKNKKAQTANSPAKRKKENLI
jgi:hypothetical protein